MKPRKPLAGTLLALALLVLTSGSGAQDNAGTTAQASPPGAAAAKDPDGTAADTAGEASPDSRAAESSADSPNSTVVTPRDYEASEQIREDLPVSFPVDI